MKRRDFITRSTGAVTLPLLFGGVPLKAFDGPALQELFNTDVPSDRVLVLIQLNGGNDGLNTVIPLDQYSAYAELRPNIAIAETKSLKLNAATGLHPSMTGIESMWKDRQVAIVQGVSYPNPNQSHFRSTDIWMSASDSNTNVPSGWLGRYLNEVYENYPNGYPNATMPDPVAIQMGAVTTLSLIGSSQQAMGIALQDPETFYKLVSKTELSTDDLPNAKRARANVEYVREVQSKANVYSDVIKHAADKATNKAEFPSGNKLADQLKIVSRLVAGGLKTRVYVVNLGGFDTHAAQVDATDTSIGTHATLLKNLSEAIHAFQNDLQQLGVADRVIAMTFSEFGRRPYSNLSDGTDHGTSAPMFVFGTNVQDGVLGTSPSLSVLDKDNLMMQFDFRQVYASVLEQWFGADPAVIREVLFKDFTTLPVIRSSTTDIYEHPIIAGVQVGSVSPNPVSQQGRICYSLQSTCEVKLAMYDALGFYVGTLVNTTQAAGTYEVPLEMSAQPSGAYFIQGTIDGKPIVRPFVVGSR